VSIFVIVAGLLYNVALMTHRLFYEDPYLREFSARVVKRTTHEGKPAVVLDRTCFYPTSGGQPHDTGTLGSARVVDVVEQGEEIVHVVDSLPASDDVKGAIDWDRRRDHMQQHHGQHLLSAAFVEIAHAETASFHLGAGACTIDLDKQASPADLDAAEDLANRVIWENRPVAIGHFTRDEVARLPVRKPPQVDGKIRIVHVKEFDCSACCGTHPRATGEVGVVLVLGPEKIKGGTRVSFVCGQRAVAYARQSHALLRGLGQKVSAPREELAAAIDRIQGEAGDTRKALRVAEKRLAGLDAVELAAGAVARGAVKFVVKVMEQKELEYLRAVATDVVAKGGTVAILGGTGKTSSLVLARSADVAVDLRPAGKEALAAIRGKGGGPANFVQGGGEGPDLKGAVEQAEARIREALKV
jgi:alanyl-tRNA synthetase